LIASEGKVLKRLVRRKEDEEDDDDEDDAVDFCLLTNKRKL